MATSVVRQNFPEECENGLNKHINLQLHLSYAYQHLCYYFDRDDVALPGFSKFFKNASKVANSHAENLMKYLNKRGGRVSLQDVSSHFFKVQNEPILNFANALDIKKKVNQHLLETRQKASDLGDGHMCHFLDDNVLVEHVETIKDLGFMITKLKRVGPGPGLYMYDKDLE